MAIQRIDRQSAMDGASIVALGSFNPTIFQPAWFTFHKLIREDEGNEAKIEVIHPQATVFSTPWFGLQVTPDRFYLETLDPTKWLPLRDLVPNQASPPLVGAARN